MNMSTDTVAIIDKGIKCLSENMGADEAEKFISTLLRERFDYTQWRSNLTDSIDSAEKLDKLIKASDADQYRPRNAKVVL